MQSSMRALRLPVSRHVVSMFAERSISTATSAARLSMLRVKESGREARDRMAEVVAFSK